MNNSSRAPVVRSNERYRTLFDRIYDEMDRQSDGVKKPDLLDRLHELLVVGIPWQVGERLLVIDGEFKGRRGYLAASTSSAVTISFTEGDTASVSVDFVERDFVALAGGV